MIIREQGYRILAEHPNQENSKYLLKAALEDAVAGKAAADELLKFPKPDLRAAIAGIESYSGHTLNGDEGILHLVKGLLGSGGLSPNEPEYKTLARWASEFRKEWRTTDSQKSQLWEATRSIGAEALKALNTENAVNCLEQKLERQAPGRPTVNPGL